VSALTPYIGITAAYIRSAKSPNTIRAYRSDWADFERFCGARGLTSLPASPATVAAYAAEGAGRLKARTVERRLTSIAQAHELARQPNPAEDKLVRTVMAGVRRVKGTAQTG
jgi:site-specific recombinase XerD